jgi:dTDP-4-amino-4,6-dideoxygalactose transaminase
MRRELGSMREEILAAMTEVVDSGVYIGGAQVSAFETEIAELVPARHAVGVSSGTDALLCLGMAMDIGPSHTVVTTPFSYVATAAPFARLGARVLFADIDEDSCNLDPQKAATLCARNTAAIVAVNLFGRPAEVADLPAAIPLIEDAAQSLGACGVRGIAATTSFFPTKNLGAMGDAGAIFTNDEALAKRASQIRAHGAAPKYHYPLLGGNFRIDALQAAILRVKLRGLQGANDARRRNAQRYHDLFRGSRISSEIRTPEITTNHVFHQYVIRTPRRSDLQAFLSAAGIGTEIYYPEPLHVQPCFAQWGYRAGSLPIAETAAKETLALPIAPTLTIDEQTYVVENIERFFRT